MKKHWFYATIVLSVVIILLLCLIIALKEDAMGHSGKVMQYAEDSIDAMQPPVSDGYAIDISLSGALIDAETAQLSSYERGQIIDEHTALWKEKIDRYEAAIASYAENYINYHSGEYSERFAEDYAKSKADWEAYYQAQMEDTQALIEDIYGAGSAGGLAMQCAQYELYKERAIALYLFCTNHLPSVPIEEWAP